MDILRQVKKLCEIYNIIPSRSKGQNFLINEKIYDAIVAAADLKPEDTVLEVGPGLGFLTAKLAKTVKRVIAVELDDKLARALKDGLDAHGVKNVEVINEDILKVQSYGYKIVANLPYNITSIFLRKFLGEAEVKPKSMTLMLQKEVAERIVAVPPKMSVLAVSVQLYAEPKIIRSVAKGNFWPAPKVDSAVINIITHNSQLITRQSIDDKKFFRLVKFGFSSKRRMLKNNLAGGLKIKSEEAEQALLAIGLNPKIRAEGLTVDDWVKLLGELNKYMV